MTIGKHTPFRMCVGCGERSPQRALVRFVATSNGLRVDCVRRAPGRGAYLHSDETCWKAFTKRKPPLRSLHRSVDRSARMELVQQLRDAVTR